MRELKSLRNIINTIASIKETQKMYIFLITLANTKKFTKCGTVQNINEEFFFFKLYQF